MKNGRRAIILIAAAGVLASALAGCGGKVVATVNGEKITRDEYYKRLERVGIPNPIAMNRLLGQIARVNPNLARAIASVPKVEVGLLTTNELISEKIISQMAKKEGATPTDQQIDYKWGLLKKSGSIAQAMRQGMTEDEIRKQLAVQQAYINVATKGIKITDKETRDYYEKNKRQFQQPERVQVRMIVTNGEAKIREAEKFLNRGVAFETVAREKSDDAGARQTGGFQAVLMKGMQNVPKELIDTAFATKKGQVSKPFRVQNTWVIIKVEDILPAINQSYADVKQYIAETLAQQKAMSKPAFAKELASFDKKAKIEVNIERYKEQIKNFRNLSRPTVAATPAGGG